MKIGDVSRSRRFADPARLRWYAFHRSVRFARRMMQSETRIHLYRILTLESRPGIAVS
jgi:hypothetical protein